MYSVQEYWLMPVGFPIRISPDQSLVADSPKLFAGSNVLHRLQLPRHPPYALIRLTIYRSILRYTAANTSFGATQRQRIAAPHTGYTLDLSYVCTTHILRRSQTHHTPAIALSHFHLVKEHSGCKTQTKTTLPGRFSLHSLHRTLPLHPTTSPSSLHLHHPFRFARLAATPEWWS